VAHIPDGFLSAPVLVGTAATSAGAVVAATRRRARLPEHRAPLLGALTAFVFAVQMLNFPLGAGTSAHLLGGVLVAVMVGPWDGILVLFSVVLVQALLFQDGGIAALGANTLNLAVVGAGGGWLLYRWAFALVGAGRRLLAVGIAAFLAAVSIGVAVSAELALSGTVPFTPALVAVGGSHVLVGLSEALITVGILRMVRRARPELLAGSPLPSQAAQRWAIGTTAAAVLLAAGAYLASTRPDALEAAAARLGLSGADASALPSVASVPGGPWSRALVGLVAAFGCAWLLFRLSARRDRAL
jgi:cobalt/nickel transport system permease protein